MKLSNLTTGIRRRLIGDLIAYTMLFGIAYGFTGAAGREIFVTLAEMTSLAFAKGVIVAYYLSIIGMTASIAYQSRDTLWTAYKQLTS